MRKVWRAVLAWVTVAAAGAILSAQVRPRESGSLDVRRYYVHAEINPHTQSLRAEVDAVVYAVSAPVSFATFELNDALTVRKVLGADQKEIPFQRFAGDHQLRLSLPEPLKPGEPYGITFIYDGQLTGQEESPVYGICFAQIEADHAYLLYPARWFPVTGYTEDRFTAEFEITVPAGFSVIAPGLLTERETSDSGVTYHFNFDHPSFPASLAVVQGEGVKVTESGVTTAVFFRGENAGMAGAYGTETGKVVSFLTALFGLPPQANLTLVETGEGAPNSYSAPGILFLSSNAIGKSVNQRLLAGAAARQWWEVLFSPRTRNHLWISNGISKYSEVMYLESINGPAWTESEIQSINVEALTVQEPPAIQASRLEDYSIELVALTYSKGAAVLHMLRKILGEEKFRTLLREIPEKYAWQEIDTSQFSKEVSRIAGQNLDYFFLQWIESQGAPEFRLEYTVYRTQSGFRVIGKVMQDLDLFRMPVKVRVETEGNPEESVIEVAGTSTEFLVDTFGRPKKIILNPDNSVLSFNERMRVAVAIRRGEQFAEIGKFNEALNEYQKALDVRRNSSLAHYRVGEVFFLQGNYQSAANEFREALAGDLDPAWTEVWSHINLGKIFDITMQRERAVNEYRLALRTKDNTQGAQEEAARYLNEPYRRSN